MALVKLPVPMRAYTDNQTEFHISGSTVGEVLSNLTAQFSSIGEYLFNDRRQLRPFVTIFINQVNIKDLQDLATPVRDEDRLVMILSIAGGI
jgi:molybdopterin converting factor small subunit